MANPIYAFWADEIGHTVTPTLSTATADANYPITNIKDGNPENVFLTSTSSTVVNIDWDHASAVDAKLVSLHHHNIPAGTVVTITRGATQGSTTMSGSITIATYPNTGLPLPQFLDLTALASYGNYRWTRVSVPSLAQKVGIGELLIWNQKRAGLRNLMFPFHKPDAHPRRRFRTSYGVVNELRLGVRLRSLSGTISTTATDFATFVTLFRTVNDDTNPFLFIPDPSVDDAWLSKFQDDTLDVEYVASNHLPMPFTIFEVSNGARIPTS